MFSYPLTSKVERGRPKDRGCVYVGVRKRSRNTNFYCCNND